MSNDVIPSEFFTLQSMLTLTGATGAVFVVANGLRTAFDWNPKWIGLALSEIIAIGGVALTNGHGLDYFIGVINGFLIFSTSAGVASMGGTTAAQRRGEALNTKDFAKGGPNTGAKTKRFWGSWF
jgi:hypothetical protein